MNANPLVLPARAALEELIKHSETFEDELPRKLGQTIIDLYSALVAEGEDLDCFAVDVDGIQSEMEFINMQNVR